MAGRQDLQVNSNMLGLISRLKVDMPLSGRGRQWRRRGGSHRQSFMSTASQDSQRTFADAEEEFLHAAEFGDIPGVKRLLGEFPELNVDCIDALGRTALRLAVKNEHLEVVEVLLERSSQHHIYEAVLQAISAGHVQIAETILKHRRYLEMWRERRKLGDTDGFFKSVNVESQFSPDITPLILAAQKNQYEIVQLLLLRGERIQKPHKFTCGCQECKNRVKFDQLRLAKYRLNAYRGLGSEAYISLSSKDPILTAFELAQDLRHLANVEKHFKREYIELANSLSEFVVKLLDRVRTQEELDFVLNKTGRPNQELYDTLSRIKLALSFREKKFVAHPNCQQRLVSMWYNGMGKFERAGWPYRSAMLFLFLIFYPFLVVLHIVAPGCKFAKVLEYPFVKFMCHTMSFVAFLVMIVVSTAESSKTVSSSTTLMTLHQEIHQAFLNMSDSTLAVSVYGHDFPLRAYLPTFTQVLLSLWIVGLLCQECNQLFENGAAEHFSSVYNMLDFLLLAIYLASFTLRYLTMYKFHESLKFLGENRNSALSADDKMHRLYWLNADRFVWDPLDPVNMAEGLFALANILSFSRISNLLPANETLGPLQISLGRMLKDIAKFLVLFLMVMAAFMVGLTNLFWYYSSRSSIEVTDHGNFTVKAQESFGDVMATFRTVFWSLFGRGEPTAVTLGEYHLGMTEDIGYFIYGAYNVSMVTVLLNMLIAMMSRSFTNIAEDSDVEWKYARSLLYLEYINEGSTLPVPLNMIGAPKALMRAIFCGCCSCGKKQEEAAEEEPATPAPEPHRNGAMADLESGGVANPSDSCSAVEIYEANMKNGNSRPQSKKDNDKLTYQLSGRRGNFSSQKVMQTMIQRYIFDIQREAEVTEDDFEEIKQDISSFRYEIMNQWRLRDVTLHDMSIALNQVLRHVEVLTGSEKSPTAKTFAAAKGSCDSPRVARSSASTIEEEKE